MGKRERFSARESELGRGLDHGCARGHERECGCEPEPERGRGHAADRDHDAGVAALLRERLRDAARDRKEHLATFSRYYESRDRKLCVFEDEHGHFTSVRADRLA